jgi:anthranilate/para-aminobenzoate synthase component II
MRFIKPFNEDKKTLAYNEEVLKMLPKRLCIYTSDGSFELDLGQSTRETDVIRAFYSHETSYKDGEPDNLSLDIHLMKNERGFKTIVDIIYGNTCKHQISIEAPNKVKAGIYNGVRSVNDSPSHFGFDDQSIIDLCNFFNSFNFGYNLKPEDLKSIDKYPNSYKHDKSGELQSLKGGVKNTFNEGDSIILVIDNTKEPEHNFLNSVINYLKFRGESFEVVSTIEELDNIKSKYKVIGAISTGSDYRLSQTDEGSDISIYAYKSLDCPIIGFCYGFQTMVKFYGGEIVDNGKHIHDHLKLTSYKQDHFLFKDFDIQDVEFSFSFNDLPKSIPSEFKQISMLDDVIVGISDEERKRYGFLFHPEDIPATYPILDNFIGSCKGKMESDEQKKLQQGKFEHLTSFKKFKYF